MNLNPVYKKELKINVRGIRIPITLVIFNLILSITGLLVFQSILENVRWSGNIDYGTSITLYVLMIVIQFILLILIVPSLTAGAISGERERQTFEILLSTGMEPRSIVLGKLLSSLSTVILLVVSSMPVISLVFVFGGISIADIFGIIVFLIFVAAYAGSIGLFCSARLKKTTSATVLTYGFILLIGAGTLFIVGIATVLAGLNSTTGNINIGPISWILLLNPGITFATLLAGQVGNTLWFTEGLKQIGVPAFLSEHWLLISIIIQIAVVGFFLLGAIKKTTPIKNKSKVKKINEAEKITVEN